MKHNLRFDHANSRRSFLKTMLAASAAPWFVPAHVLGADRKTAPSKKITVGVIGVGAQGHGDMRNFLNADDARFATSKPRCVPTRSASWLSSP